MLPSSVLRLLIGSPGKALLSLSFRARARARDRREENHGYENYRTRRRRMSRQNGTCPWEQTADAFMRFKSPKRGPFPRLCIIHRYLAAPECFMRSLLSVPSFPARSFSSGSSLLPPPCLPAPLSGPSFRRVSLPACAAPHERDDQEVALYMARAFSCGHRLLAFSVRWKSPVNGTARVLFISAYIMRHYVRHVRNAGRNALRKATF